MADFRANRPPACPRRVTVTLAKCAGWSLILANGFV